ncbi:MAG: tRNA (N(6)-L-threonylcarbamoyladenosine(37)-C(2))-methylthiotransferase MtaB [Prosthecochloris sp.]|nr:tRNA (N(6)-L-threonylcarbamoyladenosine(37)-C(2))-methylthiotransferase MtaB [Prosthecochloris sp.]
MTTTKSDNRKRVFAVTLGCKLNYAETSSILQQFIDQGWEVASKGEPADVVLVHTCTVTAQAGQKSRQAIRRMIRAYPESRIVVTGCYAQLDPDIIGDIEGVDVILGTGEKYNIAYYHGQKNTVVERYITPAEELDRAVPAHSLLSHRQQSRTRAFLKIQDGCDYGCAYCAIPLARGRSRSVPPGTVFDNAQRLAAAGYREIVLTGVNIADYRYGDDNIVTLLQRLDSVDVLRIRISSIEPDRLTRELIDTVASSQRIMPHFHLPLQGGSDAILRAMGRRYTIETYRERFMAAIECIPDCAIGADIMTGYPGETEEDFRSSVRLVEDLPMAYLHIFTCSLRPGTALWRQVQRGLRTPVPHDVLQHRSRILHDIGEKKKRAFLGQYTGRDLDVLFEERTQTQEGREVLAGYSRNYLRVRADASSRPDSGELTGTEQRVHVTGTGADLELDAIFVT